MDEAKRLASCRTRLEYGLFGVSCTSSQIFLMSVSRDLPRSSATAASSAAARRSGRFVKGRSIQSRLSSSSSDMQVVARAMARFMLLVSP